MYLTSVEGTDANPHYHLIYDGRTEKEESSRTARSIQSSGSEGEVVHAYTNQHNTSHHHTSLLNQRPASRTLKLKLKPP